MRERLHLIPHRQLTKIKKLGIGCSKNYSVTFNSEDPALNPTFECVPSQFGFEFDAPHLHKAAFVCPSTSTMYGPFSEALIVTFAMLKN